MLSVVLAVHNEEKNLPRCLEAVKKLADEIVIVDGESTDQTAKVAKQFKTKVISTTNKANFHINKQLGNDAAKGELILQLDADEVVDEKLADFITQLHADLKQKKFQVERNQPVAWYLKRKNLFLGHFLRKGGQYPDPVIRLFIKGKARLPQQDVHEQMQVDGLVATAEGHLIHYANPTFSDYLRKFNTYTSFKAEQLADADTPFTFWSALNHLLLKPTATFFSLYIRHKGFLDGVAGLVFAKMSGLHHLVAWLKYWEILEKRHVSTIKQ